MAFTTFPLTYYLLDVLLYNSIFALFEAL